MTALHTLAGRCHYGVMKERMTLDRFVVGLRDCKLSEALQMYATLNLKTALSRARTKEAVQQQQHQLDSSAYHQALRLTQFIEKLAGGQNTNGLTKTSESVRRVAEPVIGSHRVLQKERSAKGANDGDTSLRCANKGRTSRMLKQVHPRKAKDPVIDAGLMQGDSQVSVLDLVSKSSEPCNSPW
ncbi:hypothetical protein MRX96_054730 [Rhipicephalus microplus]